MFEQHSAEIVPFPRTAEALPDPEPIPAPAVQLPGEERLQRALAMLVEAQNEQKAALARWRGAISDLHASMHCLGTSLSNYNGALRQIPLKNEP